MVYSTLTAVLVVLVAALSFSARQPPPPQIAELTPQAQHQITRAPTQLGSAVGSAKGGSCTGGGPCGKGPGAGGQVTTATAPSTAPPAHLSLVNTAAVHHCFGNPPRQIQDPQSPPCIAYWAGNNGGSTSMGVTANQITVVTSGGDVNCAPGATCQRSLADYQNFFDSEFELYGRRIKLIPYTCSNNVTPAQMQADATGIYQEYHPFAELSYCEDNGEEAHFYDALARLHVISVEAAYTGPDGSEEPELSSYAPYEWNYEPSPDKILVNYGEFICKDLAGRPPVYAGPPQSFASVRKFGIIRMGFTDGTPEIPIDSFLSTLASCGVQPVIENTQDGQLGTAQNAILNLKGAGVTSIMCLCHTSDLATEEMPYATAEAYHPEWLISNYIHQDDDFAANDFPKDQAAHVLGLQSLNKSLPQAEQPAQWALDVEDPGYFPNFLSLAGFTYENLLLLASGIQMAGPDLTPESFQRALFSTQFPNPAAGGPPFYQATVGFSGPAYAASLGAHTHTMIEDLVPVWWSSSVSSNQVPGQQGAYCYVDSGRRYGPGQWPANLVFFQGPCQ